MAPPSSAKSATDAKIEKQPAELTLASTSTKSKPATQRVTLDIEEVAAYTYTNVLEAAQLSLKDSLEEQNVTAERPEGAPKSHEQNREEEAGTDEVPLPAAQRVMLEGPLMKAAAHETSWVLQKVQKRVEDLFEEQDIAAECPQEAPKHHVRNSEAEPETDEEPHEKKTTIPSAKPAQQETARQRRRKRRRERLRRKEARA